MILCLKIVLRGQTLTFEVFALPYFRLLYYFYEILLKLFDIMR